MSTISVNPDTFLSDLLAKQTSLNGESSVIKKLRQRGVEDVKQTAFPGKKDEDWRFISLRELYSDSYVPASQIDVQLPDIGNYYLPESEHSRLVFVNGRYSAAHSSTSGLPDAVTIGNIADLADEGNENLEAHLNEYGDFENDIFSSFNTALLRDGAFIHVPEGTNVDAPVHVLFINTDADQPYFTTSRCLVLAEENTDLTLVEEHIGLGDNKYFALPVVEINLERDAYVKHTKIQRESRAAIHIARNAAHIKQHANYESYTITLGAKLSRNEPRITQLEEEVEFTVDGLVLIDGDQVSDTVSPIVRVTSYINA